MNRYPTKKGYSLLEMLIYISILTVIFILIVNTTISFTRSYRDLFVLRAIEHSAITSLERMTRDIRNSTSLDTVQSAFGTTPGTLVINQTIIGTTTVAKFYVQSGVLKVDVGGAYVGPLTLSNVVVTNLTFTQLLSGNSSAVKIDLTLQGTSGQVVKSKKFHSTIILKGS